jgi:bleomycin hydrolase
MYDVVSRNLDESHALTAEDITSLQEKFYSTPQNAVMQNVIIKLGGQSVTLNRHLQKLSSAQHTFSHTLKHWNITDQKSSGRCWLFAGLNVLRCNILQHEKHILSQLKKFEFSQSYLFFFDKLERSNLFLEYMWLISQETTDTNDRTISFLLHSVCSDGGQWHMFVNLVEKYGVVPERVMPDRHGAITAKNMNLLLKQVLRHAARDIFELQKNQVQDAKRQFEIIRAETLSNVYTIISMHLGTPPQQFTYEELIDAKISSNKKDKKKTNSTSYVEIGTVSKSIKTTYTPLEFYYEHVKPFVNLNDYICLIDDPRNPKERTYTRSFSNNVIPSTPEDAIRKQVLHINVDIELMKEAAMRSIVEHQEAVWMGCEFSRNLDVSEGVLNEDLFNFSVDVYGWKKMRSMTKCERLDYKHSASTHAMVIVGVHVQERDEEENHFLVREKEQEVMVYPDRWNVENSHGEKSGKKGFYVMMDNWFNENVYEIVVHKKVLPEEVKYDTSQVIVLPPWDVMGSGFLRHRSKL